MSHYRQKTIKELYRPQDIIPAIIGVICAISFAVFMANFATSYAGLS